jgi:sporulation-control protein spo0M
MGISGAPAFKWANDKRDRLLKLQSVGTLHQNKLDQMSDPANRELNQQSSHPTYQQRFDAAGQQGFELSQVDTDQLDRFIQHMTGIA